jgi:arginyl-tRNA synthetase
VRDEFRRVTELCLDGQRAILARLGITYDCFQWESAFAHDPFLTEVCDRLRERGVLFTDDHGREVADLKPLGFSREEGRYVVLRRANGSSLYFLRDLAFNRFKAEQGARWNLIVLGEDHKLYFEQLSLILQAASIQPPEPVYYSYVLLREGKMSTRKGNLVLLTDFLDEASSRAHERVRQANARLTPEEVDQLAGIIGSGAVKFSMLRVAPQNNVTFDWDQALTFEGDSGPYIQYACARINSIFQRGGREVVEPTAWHALEDAEWDLMLSLLPLPERLASAITQRNPAILADFALSVARPFNRFYHTCPVLDAPAPASEARLWLCKATLRVLQQTLGLLGIEVPARM